MTRKDLAGFENLPGLPENFGNYYILIYKTNLS